MGKAKDVKAMKRILKKLDPDLDEKQPEFLSALVLLSMTEVGTATRPVQKFIGHSYEKIETIIGRLKKQGVVKGKKLHVDWFEEDTGGVGFWCDAMVGTGMLNRGKATRKSNGGPTK